MTDPDPAADSRAADQTRIDSELANRAVALTQELVRLDSQNPGLVPGAAGETVIVARLEQRLTRTGFDCTVVRPGHAPDRPSLLARHRGTGGGLAVLLNGHLDTVGVGGMPDPFGATIDGGRLAGRGASDMKGGVAAMVVAAERVVTLNPAGDVWLALVADEEDGSLGTAAVLAELDRTGQRPDVCLVGEPSWLDLVTAHRGFALLEVVLRGRAAHSSQPDQGVNAVTHLGRLLVAVERQGQALAGGPGHPLTGPGSVTVTVVRGGEAPFSLPDRASALVERRTMPGDPPGGPLAEVEALLAGLRADDGDIDATVRVLVEQAPWQLGPAEAARRLADGLLDQLQRRGRTPQAVGAPYWMESALWEAAGIPTVVCGPAGGGLHADDEWLDLGQLGDYVGALSATLADLTGATGDRP